MDAQKQSGSFLENGFNYLIKFEQFMETRL
jgi:hypothetical protein